MLNSSVVVAGADALATDLNEVREDGVYSGFDFASSTGSANAYLLAVDSQLTAYVTGLIVRFAANFANTTAAPTLNVNSIGAVAIISANGDALRPGDIQNGQHCTVQYDGSSWRLVSQKGNSPVKFGGTGADGALTISSGTTTIDLGNAEYFEKNYSSISITGTGNLAFSNPATNGTVVHLKCSGSCTITSSATRAIDLRSLGASGGTGGSSAFGNGATGSQPTDVVGTSTSGGGGGGVAGDSQGGSAGARFDSPGLFSTSSQKVNVRRSLFILPGAGGGGGEAGNGVNFGAGGAGGRGGGSLILEVFGAYSCSGTIDASGAAGSTGTGGGASSGSGGGGGGGAGGMILVIYGSLTSDTGTYTVTAGGAGSGGTGGGGTGGGGGGGAGGITSAGTAGSTTGNTNGAAGGASVAGVAVRMQNKIFA